MATQPRTLHGRRAVATVEAQARFDCSGRKSAVRRRSRSTPVLRAIKRATDIAIAALALAVLLPFLLLLALLIKLDSRGPVLFKQRRLGRETREFTMFKFRSMYANSDELSKELLRKNESCSRCATIHA
jgi:lipopolysaccharide/colanic/teichoic acid biosynthesis glycosyltransferase